MKARWTPLPQQEDCARQLVVVTINYRLGSSGFFSHSALRGESPHRTSGNQGLLDQMATLPAHLATPL
jgi:para-nitrobenzyl esterase